MIVQGTAYWAKILGAPKWGYENQYKEWSIDVAIDSKTKKKLLAEGMSEAYVRNKGDEKGDFLTFKRRETKKDGEPAKPFQVIGPDKAPWPQNKLIGNGSTVNILVLFNEAKHGMKPALIKLQVVELKEYEGDDADDGFPAYDASGEEENWEVED